MPPSSTTHTQTPRELLSTITPLLAHLAAMSPPTALAVSNAIPASQLFLSSDVPPSSTPQLPYPLVASSTASAVPAQLGQMTALQSNPVALTETSLIQAGLTPPPPFPLYLGPSTPEVQTHFADNLAVRRNSRSGPSITRLKLLLFPVTCGNNANPPQHVDPSVTADDPHPWSYQILQEDIGPMERQFECIGLVINMIVHDGLLSFSDIHHAIAQHQALSESPKIPSFNSDPDVSYLMSGWCLQQMWCVRNHTSLRCCKKAYKTGAYWCLQMLTAYASMVKAPVDTGGHSNPTLKHVFIIAPTYGNIVHSIEKCYVDDFRTPINLAKACLPHPCFVARAIFGLAFLPCMLENSYQAEEERCLQLCRSEDPNLYPTWGGSQVHSITCPPHPTVTLTVAPSLSSLSTSTSMVSSANRTTWLMQEENHDKGMVVDNDNDKENQSPGMAQPSVRRTHVELPANLTSSSFNGIHHLSRHTFHGLPLPSVHPNGTTLLRIHAKDVREAADVFWRVLLHIRSIMPKLPPGKVIVPRRHGEPVLPPQASVTNWWRPEVFLDGTIIQQGQGVSQSIYASVLAVNLMKIIDTTDPNCQFSRLPNNSLLVSPRFPILDLISDQAGFWWAVRFLLALFSTATGQACLPVQDMLIHVLLLHALGQCHYQIDHWTPSFIYSTDPAMGELMLPWLDLGKTQAMTGDPDGKDHLKEPVPQFLMAYCSDILSMSVGFGPHHAAVHENYNRAICAYLMLSNAVFDLLAAYHALHAGFHQPFSIEFGSLTRGLTLPSMIKDACECKNKTALEFIYWWFNNRLERVEQLIPHLEYDIGPIVNTPQNNLSFTHGEAETLAHRVSRAFQNTLKEYLRVDVKERGKQLLLAMMACPYLPTNPDKKLKFQFRLLNDNVRMDVPTMKSLWSFVHGCFQTIDIGYDGVLASLLVNGLWRGITIDSYFQGIFMGDVTCFNAE
ncbi:hypothetical protein EDD18DRAFT_1358802 [Armillaria luteobubalina]|uniref:Uncharacterized protein n=1 Tax=Armillaria luteobubalina TaxID=153913 RepID=A0AA39PU19_9AGAR|nr:hypothetical protein EDD18DRAFT_1358802 [Armillaria luteobubalina]